MPDRLTLHTPSMPLWRRLSRWLGSSTGAGRSRANGADSARMDLGYEAAYAPIHGDKGSAPSRFEEDRPAA
ncbi:MAG: hypothetical protein RLZZ373_537 [Pseudomonadota bacterium]